MSHPSVHSETPRVAVACGCTLGEAPVWDHRTGTLLWVDIKTPAVWRFSPDNGATKTLPIPEPIGFVALTHDPDWVIAGLKTGLARLRLSNGDIRPIVAPEPDQPGNRINDGFVGPDGSLYFGTLDEGGSEPAGFFYRWDGRDLTRFHGGFVTTNGPAASHDGRTLYTVDTPGGLISAHDLTEGQPGEPRRFAGFQEGWGRPDGLAVDAEGHVWSCHWGGSRITRFAPDGSVERTLPVPTALVTKCAFGGPDLTTLYITTASQGRDPHVDLMAGHLFTVETGIKGLPANLFRDAAP